MSVQQPQRPERGLNNYRIDFVREAAVGQLPAAPDFLKFSDTPTTFSFPVSPNNQPRRGLGDADPKDFQKGPEEHEITVEYDLVKWFTQNAGDAWDASYDGLVRTIDNFLPNTHTIVAREDKGQINSASTVEARISDPASATAKETRVYSVARGAQIDEVSASGDPSDSQPIVVELSYMAPKARSYQVDQPPTAQLLWVKSTDANDTMDVTIESEGGATTETLTLNGTTAVQGATSFGDVDAVSLASEPAGDVTVHLNDTSGTNDAAAEAITCIYGSSNYADVEGDLGIPTMNGGTREDPSTLPAPQTFLGDRVLRSTDPYPHEFQSVTLNCSNNVESTERSSALGMAMYPGQRELTLEAEVFGETATHDLYVDALTTRSVAQTWEMKGGDVDLDGVTLTEPGERSAESDQAVMTSGNTFTATGIAFTEAA